MVDLVKYDVSQKLGAGATGEVYKGWLTQAGVKLLGGQKSYCDSDLENAQKESEAEASNSELHPVVCKVEPIIDVSDQIEDAKWYSHTKHCQLRLMELTRTHQVEMAKHGLLRLYGTVLVDPRLAEMTDGGLIVPENKTEGLDSDEHRADINMDAERVHKTGPDRNNRTQTSDSTQVSASGRGSTSGQPTAYRITIMDLAPPNSYCLSELIGTSYRYGENYIVDESSSSRQ